MAEVRFTREEIEEIVKERFKVNRMEWEDEDLIVDMDIGELEEHKEKKKEEPQEDTYQDLSDLSYSSEEEDKME